MLYLDSKYYYRFRKIIRIFIGLILHALTMRIVSILFLSLYTSFVLAQIDAGDDITICELGPVNLSADYTPSSVGTNDYTIESIPINTDPYDGTTIPNLTDDSYTDIINIGFNFCF